MIISAGLLLIKKDTILLVKQKNVTSERCFSIPKGIVESGESILNTAIRETYEETGLKIPENKVSNHPYILNYYNIKDDSIYKQIYYFICIIQDQEFPMNPICSDEIESASFLTYCEAKKKLFVQQLSVLNHLNHSQFDNTNLEWLLRNGFIKREIHPIRRLLIYNYTNKCKRLGYWNETTLWCRGLILDEQNNIIARPLKKFFEYSQLYNEYKLNLSQKFDLYEKLDGSLGILYWIDNLPYIATRGSFISQQAYKATLLLYTQYSNLIRNLNTKCTYYFEIIYPENKHIIDYSNLNDIFLLGAYDNVKNLELSFSKLKNTGFNMVTKIQSTCSLEELLLLNENNKEGFVVRFMSGFRLKIKFQNYKDLHQKIIKQRNNEE